MIEQEYDDIFAGLSDDITKNLFIRYYAMEEYFEIPLDEGMKEEEKEKEKKVAVTLVYNKIIHETIYELYIMNKLIYSKARIATTLLDNGKDIAKKKNAYWMQFLELPEFKKIKMAYNLLEEPKKNILKFAVLSLSNLLLKLGINMSKISVIPIQKMLTFQCLNIPVFAIIFLQFLQYKLFTSKKYTQEIHKTMFLRQLPKIAVVKLSKYKNNTEIENLETAQQLFFTKHSEKIPIKNIQYIELYEEEDPLYSPYQRQTNYDNIMSFSLKDKFKISAPFTFQILLLMRSLIFPLIRDFKPDLIVYYESSYSCERIIMDEEVRGLMLCEMSEETACNKMYVIKEIGDSKYDRPELLKENGNGQQICKNKIDEMNKIDKERGKELEREKLAKPATQEYIRRIKKVLLNDLCFISLALIQKTTFETIEEASHQHFYKKEYLEGLANEQKRILDTYEKKDEAFSRIMANKRMGVNSMLDVLKYKISQTQKNGFSMISLINRETYFSDFFNFMDDRTQKLIIQGTNQEIRYNEEDQFYVKYFVSYILVFIIKSKKMIVLSKKKNQEKMVKEAEFQLDDRNKNLEGSILVSSEKYLYRGFGRYKGTDHYNQSIQRFRIHPEVGKAWQMLEERSTPIHSDGKEGPETPLEKKIYGYGMYDEKHRNVIMMGGYLEAANEQKISKTLYIIKNDCEEQGGNPNILNEKKKIYSMGKTNKVLFLGVNEPLNKMFLHPFIFGIPFTSVKPPNAFILNCNGNYINVNNTKKLFITNFKLSSVIMYNGITSQKKLLIDSNLKETDMSEIIVQAELLVKYIVLSNYQNNMYENNCCIQTQEEGRVFIKADQANNCIKVERGDCIEEGSMEKEIDNQTVVLKFI